MRDGVKLFTSVYVPKDLSQKYPIMLDRTPYSVAPYGLDNYRKELGPSEKFGKDGFIFVYQDVRGGNMAHLNYYAGLCGYIHAKKQGSLVFGNPGTDTVEDNFKYNAADALMISNTSPRRTPDSSLHHGCGITRRPAFPTPSTPCRAHPQ